MKTLFEFTINKKVEVEETETVTTIEEGGAEVKTTKTKTIEKEIPVKLAIKKPTRDLVDAGKLFFAVKTSEAYKEGVISEVLLQKRLANDGGALSEREKSEFGDLYLNFFQKQQEYSLLNEKNFDDLTEEEKFKKKSIFGELGLLSQKISIFQSNHSAMFENTVEAYARNHSLRWWVLHLCYTQKLNDKNETQPDFVPLYGVGDYNAKLKVYDSLEEKEDVFYIESIKRLANLIGNWYQNNANSPEEFQKLLDAYNSEEKSNEE